MPDHNMNTAFKICVHTWYIFYLRIMTNYRAKTGTRHCLPLRCNIMDLLTSGIAVRTWSVIFLVIFHIAMHNHVKKVYLFLNCYPKKIKHLRHDRNTYKAWHPTKRKFDTTGPNGSLMEYYIKNVMLNTFMYIMLTNIYSLALTLSIC